MPKPDLRIGVLTLSPGDETQLKPETLGAELQSLISNGNLRYTPAPDDWMPFDDGTTILRHLQDGLDTFQLFSDSANLASLSTRRRIKLFVIDPAVLLHPAKARLAELIQEHVCSCYDKASCIVIYGSLPAQFAKELSKYYERELRDLISEANSSLFEYKVEDVPRLKQFLRRVTPLLGDVPVSPRNTEALLVLAAINRTSVPTIEAPALGMGAGK
jgi:hypothetical protein